MVRLHLCWQMDLRLTLKILYLRLAYPQYICRACLCCAGSLRGSQLLRLTRLSAWQIGKRPSACLKRWALTLELPTLSAVFLLQVRVQIKQFNMCAACSTSRGYLLWHVQCCPSSWARECCKAR